MTCVHQEHHTEQLHLPSTGVPPIPCSLLRQTVSFRSLLLEVTSPHVCHILFIRVNRFSPYSRGGREHRRQRSRGTSTTPIHTAAVPPWKWSPCAVHSGYSRGSHSNTLFPSLWLETGSLFAVGVAYSELVTWAHAGRVTRLNPPTRLHRNQVQNILPVIITKQCVVADPFCAKAARGATVTGHCSSPVTESGGGQVSSSGHQRAVQPHQSRGTRAVQSTPMTPGPSLFKMSHSSSGG